MPSLDQPVTTLGQLAKQPPRWVWIYCENTACLHYSAVALIPFIIRWGPNASSDRLRRLRCKKCGHRNASLKTASWGDNQTGYAPFPDWLTGEENLRPATRPIAHCARP